MFVDITKDNKGCVNRWCPNEPPGPNNAMCDECLDATRAAGPGYPDVDDK